MNRTSPGVLTWAAHWPSSVWLGIGIMGSAVGTASLAFLFAAFANNGWRIVSIVLGACFGASLGGGLPLLIFLLLTNRARLREAKRQRLEARAFANIRHLTDRLPVDLSGWAADPSLTNEVIRTLVSDGARRIVECGSGWTTVLIARCLAEIGAGHIVAFEHLKQYAERSRRLLSCYDCSEYATVVHAPVTDRKLDGGTRPWYGMEANEAVTEPIDLLLVDGPPADLAEESRYPALPLLKDRLASDAVIILDDGRRKAETNIAHAWGRQLEVEPRFVDSIRGIWIFRLEDPPVSPSSNEMK